MITDEHNNVFFKAAKSTTYINCEKQVEEYSIAFNGHSSWTMEREDLILLRDTINNLLNEEGGTNHE